MQEFYLYHLFQNHKFMVQPCICRSIIGTICFKIINLWWSHFIGSIFLIINVWCIHLYVYLGVLLVAFFNVKLMVQSFICKSFIGTIFPQNGAISYYIYTWKKVLQHPICFLMTKLYDESVLLLAEIY